MKWWARSSLRTKIFVAFSALVVALLIATITFTQLVVSREARRTLSRELLTTGGRTLAQGALGWILAKSPVALPVPGFKTPEQVRDNLGALEKGPLPQSVMQEIDVLLKLAA